VAGRGASGRERDAPLEANALDQSIAAGAHGVAPPLPAGSVGPSNGDTQTHGQPTEARGAVELSLPPATEVLSAGAPNPSDGPLPRRPPPRPASGAPSQDADVTTTHHHEGSEFPTGGVPSSAGAAPESVTTDTAADEDVMPAPQFDGPIQLQTQPDPSATPVLWGAAGAEPALVVEDGPWLGESMPGSDVPPAGQQAVEVTAGGIDDVAHDPPRSAYARLTAPNLVISANEFELVVGLAPEQEAGVIGEALVRPPTSIGAYTLAVHVVADAFSLRAGERWRHELRVTKDAPTRPRRCISRLRG
jgi:hypothetical protein